MNTKQKIERSIQKTFSEDGEVQIREALIYLNDKYNINVAANPTTQEIWYEVLDSLPETSF